MTRKGWPSLAQLSSPGADFAGKKDQPILFSLCSISGCRRLAITAAIAETASSPTTSARSNCWTAAASKAPPKRSAHGFTVEQMVELVRAGLVSTHAERMVASTFEVARVRIKGAG